MALNVVIPEPIPSKNKGEAAILRGIHEALKLNGAIKLTLYAPMAWFADDRLRYGEEIELVDGLDYFGAANAFLEKPKRLGTMHLWKRRGKLILFAFLTRISTRVANGLIKNNLLKAISAADLIVAGHNGMLSSEHYWFVLAAKIMGTPIALYGGGNDFKGRSSKWRVRAFFRFMADHALFFSVRDMNTRDCLIANGIDPSKVHLFPDPAVLLRPAKGGRIDALIKTERIPTDKPLYGLIPVRGGIVFDKAFTAERDPEKKHKLRVSLWVDILLHLLDTTDAHFVLIPHCIGPTKIFDDSRMLRDLYAAMPRGRDRVTLIENEYTEADYKGLMKRCDYVLGERTHALIGAVSAGTPCLALTVEEDLRMHYIIRDMFGTPTFNINNPDVAKLKTLLSEEWNKRVKTRVKMQAMAETIRENALKAANMLKDRIDSVRR